PLVDQLRHAIQENDPTALVLETPYSSVQALAGERFAWLPISLLLRYSFRSDVWLPTVKSPALLIHGTRDEVIPYSHSEKLMSVGKADAELVTIEGGHHNDLGSYPIYWERLAAWLDRVTR
ncbi:MAG: hypothetical protein AAB250_00525, partial [Bdellovibrionota bacterium]